MVVRFFAFTYKEYRQVENAQVIFEEACNRLAGRIDGLPQAQRDAYIEGVADTVGAFVWDRA